MKRQNIPGIVFASVIGICLLLMLKLPSMADFLYWNTKQFLTNGMNYDAVRNINTGLDVNMLRKHLPPDAVVIPDDGFVADQKDFVFAVRRYQLYPLRVSDTVPAMHAGTPVYRLTASAPADSAAEYVVLPGGQYLSDLSGSGLQAKEDGHGPHTAHKLLVFALLSLLYFFAGALLIMALRLPFPGWPAMTAISYFAGMILLNGLCALMMLAGMKAGPGLVWLSAACSISVSLLIMRGRLHLPMGQKEPEKRKPSLAAKLSVLLLLVMLLVLVITIIVRPVDVGDSIAFWMIRAKMIFTEKAFVFDPALAHNNYPFLLPLSAALYYIMLGAIADEMAMWGTALAWILFVMMLTAFLRKITGSPAIARFSVSVFIAVFFNFYIWCNPNGDLLIIFFLCLSVMMALEYLRSGKQAYLLICWLFALGLTLSKQEGYIYALGIALLILVLSPVKYRRTALLTLAAFLAFPAVTYGWAAFMRVRGFFSGNPDFPDEGLSAEKFWLTLKVQSENVVHEAWPAALLLLFLLLTAIWYRVLKSPEIRFLSAMIFFSLAFTCFAILPWDNREILLHSMTAVPRLAAQSSPLWLLFAMFVMKKALERAGNADRAKH